MNITLNLYAETDIKNGILDSMSVSNKIDVQFVYRKLMIYVIFRSFLRAIPIPTPEKISGAIEKSF